MHSCLLPIAIWRTYLRMRYHRYVVSTLSLYLWLPLPACSFGVCVVIVKVNLWSVVVCIFCVRSLFNFVVRSASVCA